MGLETYERKQYGPRGLGTIQILPVSAAKTPSKWKEIKVTLVDRDGVRQVYRDIDPEKVEKKFGDWILKPMGKTSPVNITLSFDETNFKSIGPPDGTYIFQLGNFAAKQNEDGSPQAPTIKHKAMKSVNTQKGGVWNIPPHDEFYVLHQLVGSEIGKKIPYSGMEALQTLWYMFDRNPTTGLVQTVFDTGENSTKMFHDELMNFLIYTGYDFDADNLTPSENVLGELEPLLLGRSEFYRMTLLNGWVIAVGKGGGLWEPPTGINL